MMSSATGGPVIDEPLRPRAAWYWIGGLLIVGSAIGAVVWAVTGFLSIDDTVEGFERVPYPDGGTVTIDRPGDYVIYLEPDTALSLSGATLTDPDGDEVVTDVYSSSLTYDFGGRSGTAVETFTAEQAGDYELSSDGVDSPSIDSFAVGESIGGDLVSALVGGFVIGGLGFVLGAIVLIVTGVRRSRAKRARRPPSAPPGSWGRPAPSWGPPPGAPPAGRAPPPPPPGGAAPPPPPPTSY